MMHNWMQSILIFIVGFLFGWSIYWISNESYPDLAYRIHPLILNADCNKTNGISNISMKNNNGQNNTSEDLNVNKVDTMISIIDEDEKTFNNDDDELVVFDPSEKENLLFKGAKLRGFVDKQGVVYPYYFMKNAADMRKTQFQTWLTDYKKGKFKGHAPTPFPYCQVYINHYYKFIWIKGHKVGSTSMRKPLKWLCGDRWKVPKDADFKYCSKPLFEDWAVSKQDIKKWWNEYFVFTIIRNPYTRFASAEEYIGNMIPAHCSRPSFAETCHDIFLDVKRCYQNPCCWNGSVSHHYRHFMEQSSCIFSETLLPAVDFIGEVENMDEDFDTIISEINKRKPDDLPPLVNDLKKLNSRGLKQRYLLSSNYALKLFKKHSGCLKSIEKAYYKDFLLLGYKPLSSMNITF